jgi:hypothetical protein
MRLSELPPAEAAAVEEAAALLGIPADDAARFLAPRWGRNGAAEFTQRVRGLRDAHQRAAGLARRRQSRLGNALEVKSKVATLLASGEARTVTDAARMVANSLAVSEGHVLNAFYRKTVMNRDTLAIDRDS